MHSNNLWLQRIPFTCNVSKKDFAIKFPIGTVRLLLNRNLTVDMKPFTLPLLAIRYSAQIQLQHGCHCLEMLQSSRKPPVLPRNGSSPD